MVEPDSLGSPGDPRLGTEDPEPADFTPGYRQVFRGDKTAPRAALYWVVFLLLFVGAFAPRGSGWVTGAVFHSILETLTTVLAFIVGALALVRFYSKKEATFLFVGTGFLGAGVLETYHALFSAGLLGGWGQDRVEDLSAWSFTASAFFLAAFLLMGWVGWSWEKRHGGTRPIRELSVFLSAILLGVLFIAFFDLFPPIAATRPGHFLRIPGEWVPALLFLAGTVAHLWKGHWRWEVFDHWLVLGLLVAAMAHGAYMAFSSSPHDADFDVAHLLVLVSYVCVLIGLMGSVYNTFRKEEEAAEGFREANAALAREIDYRRQAERIIQESEERLQDFLDNAHDLIQSVAPDGKFLYVNRAWKEVLGYSDEEIEELTFFDVLHADCRERCERDFALLIGGRALPHIEVDFVTSRGRVVRCAGSANARLQDGKVAAVRSILRDITEQVEAQRELEASQANLEALVENTGDAIWSVDRSKRLITFNTAFSMASEVRTEREPQVGDRPDQCFPASDAPWYEEMYERALHGEAFSELRDEEIGGQIRSYELYFNPIRAGGGIQGVAVFGKDVTARRRTQLALRMAKEEAERANQAKSQFLASMSHELRTPLNSVIGFTNILLKNRGGNLGSQELTFLERIHANGRHLLELINEVLDLAKIEAGRMEVDLQEVDLKRLVLETVAQLEGQVKDKVVTLRTDVPDDLAPILTDPGKLKQVLINLLGNAIKFTEEGEVAVEVRASRDGRTPAEISVRDTGIGIPPERLKSIFEAFQQADGTTARKYGGTGLGLTISRSLCQLLGYDLRVESKVGEGSTFTILLEAGLHRKKSEEEALIEEALRPIRASKGSPRLPAGVPPGPRPEKGPGAPAPDGLGEDGGEDDGSEPKPGGERSEVQAPAEQAETGAPAAGSELGARNDDTMAVGTEPTDGSRAARTVSEGPVREEPAEAGLPSRTVLVIDDDPDARDLLRRHLAEAGVRVIAAASAGEGIEKARKELPDLITLDLLMPGTDGWEALRVLKDDPSLQDIPVVVVSVAVGEEERGSLVGAVDLLPKPVERDRLLRTIRRNLPHQRLDRVLVVEDDLDTQMRIREYLEEADIDVVVASNGREAETALDRIRPDAIVLDLVMPVMDGPSFLARLRGRPDRVEIPVILCTERSLLPEERRRLLSQATDILDKGEGLEEALIAALRPFLTSGGEPHPGSGHGS